MSSLSKITLFLSTLLLISCSLVTGPEYDLLIYNARIIDGTGAPAYNGSVIIHKGKIEQVGEVDPDRIRSVQQIDAEGRVVSPGFIDTHSHGNPLETPRFDNFLAMGVTTISLGMDGRSPGTGNVANWMEQVNREGTGPNILYFIGHNSLRNHVEAPRESSIDSSYISEMQSLIKQAMQAGSFGITTGLEYDHGTFAELPELITLAEPVAAYNGIVMSHLRSEDDTRIKDSVEELLEQGRQSGADVHVSHIKIVFGDDITQADEILELLGEAREEGIRVTADVYPYTASFTGISIVFPDWALPPNDYVEVVNTRRSELLRYLRNRVEMRNGPEATLFGTGLWAGMTLAEVEEYLERPYEIILMEDIGPGGASAAYFVMDEQVMQQFLSDPKIMVSSDGSPTMRHPRGYGSFAKIIRKYVNEEGLLPLEEAIRKMTGLPAQTLGLSNPDAVEIPRGLLKEGFAADLLIFDPANVRDTATFEEPHQLAEGFAWVFVNGKAVIENHTLNDELPGGVIRKMNNTRQSP